MKIYKTDPVVPYKDTRIDPITTKAEIDGLLARWGIKKTAWDWDPDNPNGPNVALQFQFTETVKGVSVSPVVKLQPPLIWNKATRAKRESINWAVSMRVMYWALKSFLEMTYLMVSDKTTAFLPYIVSSDGTQLKDLIIPRLNRLNELQALPEIQTEHDESTTIDVT